MNEVLSGDYLYDEYKPDLNQMVLDRLTPENLRFVSLLLNIK